MDNPLFPSDSQPADEGFIMPSKNNPTINPTSGAVNAADLIRDKVARIYSEEPDAKQELDEAEASSHRSPHQQFMHELRSSGKDLATIQTEWHNYYVGLSDSEKRQVWQEFYASNANPPTPQPKSTPPEDLAAHKNTVADKPRHRVAPAKLRDIRSTPEIRATIRKRVSSGGKLQTRHHVQSLLFGLTLGFVVLLIFMFGFFNERIIAPFIQPSRHASATPLIIDPNSVAPTQNPEVIIPKINVEIPVDYSQTSTDENVIENALESGIVHYPTTSKPGQIGNAAFFGHSSNNIFNKGKYKFAFVLLHELVPGDTFYLTNEGKVYVYKVFSKTVVEPSEVGVLDPVAGHSSTATLITCDPPGTSLHRLVIVGDQISPDPNGNTKVAATTTSAAPASLPSEGPTLWGRWWGTAYGKVVTVLMVLLAAGAVARRLNHSSDR